MLVTDGVTFSMSNDEIVRVVCSQPSAWKAAVEVTDNCIQLGSLDNSTALVLPLGAWGQYRPEDGNSTTGVNFHLGHTLTLRD